MKRLKHATDGDLFLKARSSEQYADRDTTGEILDIEDYQGSTLGFDDKLYSTQTTISAFCTIGWLKESDVYDLAQNIFDLSKNNEKLEYIKTKNKQISTVLETIYRASFDMKYNLKNFVKKHGNIKLIIIFRLIGLKRKCQGAFCKCDKIERSYPVFTPKTDTFRDYK